MARQIGRNILETVAFAQTHKHPSNASVRFESGTTFDGKKHFFAGSFGDIPEKKEKTTADYFWSPVSFAPWASTLLNAANAQTPKTPAPFNAELLSILTTPTAETFIREDKRLSAALTENPLDPELHEEAALLIGSFAMRETAGSSFCDIRRSLCRMTAHLALAKAARGNFGASGDLAEAVLCSLAGRETPAATIMDRLKQNAAATPEISANALAIWHRALRLHNTRDYRQLPDPEKATLFERLEYVRALRMSAGNAAASRFVTEHDFERLPEWGEQILLGDISVGDGNRWARPSFELESEAIAAHYRDYLGKEITSGELAAALNVEWKEFPQTEQASPTLHVLGWGAWAEQHQRQLCELIYTLSYWEGEMLGLPDSAKEFEEQITAQFGSLHLFPLIRFYTHPDEASSKSWIERVRTTVAAHREWISYYQRDRARQVSQRLSPPPVSNSSPVRQRKMRPQEWEQQRVANAPKIDPLIKIGSWFAPILPFGTLFDLSNRGGDGALVNSTIAEIETAKAMAPSNCAVISAHLRRTTNYKATPEQTEAAFSVLTGYDIWAMKLVADAFYFDPVRYAEKLGALCWFEPDRYVDLGNYLLEHGNETGAAQAFQNAFDLATDRVHVSNAMNWLVTYYFEQDKKDEAYKIASEGADVYSQQGLVTFANLLDRTGQTANAEWYFEKAYERYPKSSRDDLVDFYARHRDQSPAYAAEENKFRALIFPKGVEHVVLTDLRDPPTGGLVLTRNSPRTDKAGLRVSDIIVAVNGCRVHDTYEYYAARAPSTNPNVKFIIWRGGKYIEVDSFFPRRPDFSRMSKYQPRPSDH